LIEVPKEIVKSLELFEKSLELFEKTVEPSSDLIVNWAMEDKMLLSPNLSKMSQLKKIVRSVNLVASLNP
jgi:hypothetical protein